jgi:hypothetical protein
MAWIDASGRFHVYKRPGAFRDNLDVLDAVQSARVVVCHLRKTTQGCHKDNINNHPHPCDAGWFIHNGSIRNYQDLITEWGLMVSTDCDSEALGLLTCKFNETKIVQWRRAIDQVDQHDQLSMMAVYERPARLVVGRRGKPLRWWKGREGLYFASLGGGFPRKGKDFRDNQVVEYRWTRDGGGRRERWTKVDPYIAPVRVKSPVYHGQRSIFPDDVELTSRERALLERSESDSASVYLPVKYRLQNRIAELDREIAKTKKAKIRAQQFRRAASETGKRKGCVDGVRFRFDENDMLVVEGTCDDPACGCREIVAMTQCPKCGCNVFDTPYPDGNFCDCGYMNDDDRRAEFDDEEPVPNVVFCDPDDLNELEARQ